MPETVRRNIVLSKELDTRFREAVFKTKGLNKGDLSEAIAEALELWIARYAND